MEKYEMIYYWEPFSFKKVKTELCTLHINLFWEIYKVCSTISKRVNEWSLIEHREYGVN